MYCRQGAALVSMVLGELSHKAYCCYLVPFVEGGLLTVLTFLKEQHHVLLVGLLLVL